MQSKNLNYTSNLSSLLYSLGKGSILVASTKFLNSASTLLLFGTLVRNFPPNVIGRIDFLCTCIIFLVSTSNFGQNPALGRLLHEPISKEKRLALSYNSFVLQIVFAIFLSSLFFLFSSELISNNINYNGSPQILLLLVALQVPFFLTIEFCLELFRWFNKLKYYSLLSISSSLTTTLMFLVSFVDNTGDIHKVFTLYLLSRVIFAVLGLYLCIKKSLMPAFMPIKLSIIYKLLYFALPLGILNTLITLMPLWERVLVHRHLDDYALGLFALAAKIAAISTILESAFNTAWGPVYLKLSKTNSSHRIFTITLKLIAVLSSIFLLFISIFSSNIVSLIGDSAYSAAQVLIFPLALSICIQLITNVTQIGILIEKKPVYYLFCYLLYAIIFTLVFIWLVPYMGLIAIGWSIVIASLFKAYFVSTLSNKLYKIPWPYFKALIPFIISSFAAFCLSSTEFVQSNNYYQLTSFLLVSISIVLIFILLLNRFDKAFLISIRRNLSHN